MRKPLNSPLTKSRFSIPRRVCDDDDYWRGFAVDGGDLSIGSETDPRIGVQKEPLGW